MPTIWPHTLGLQNVLMQVFGVHLSKSECVSTKQYKVEPPKTNSDCKTNTMYHMHTLDASKCMHVVHSVGFAIVVGFWVILPQINSTLSHVLLGVYVQVQETRGPKHSYICLIYKLKIGLKIKVFLFKLGGIFT